MRLILLFSILILISCGKDGVDSSSSIETLYTEVTIDLKFEQNWVTPTGLKTELPPIPQLLPNLTLLVEDKNNQVVKTVQFTLTNNGNYESQSFLLERGVYNFTIDDDLNLEEESLIQIHDKIIVKQNSTEQILSNEKQTIDIFLKSPTWIIQMEKDKGYVLSDHKVYVTQNFIGWGQIEKPQIDEKYQIIENFEEGVVLNNSQFFLINTSSNNTGLWYTYTTSQEINPSMDYLTIWYPLFLTLQDYPPFTFILNWDERLGYPD